MYSNAKLEAMHGGIPETTHVDKLITMLEKNRYSLYSNFKSWSPASMVS